MTHMCCFCGSPYHDTPNCKWRRVQESTFSRHVLLMCMVFGGK